MNRQLLDEATTLLARRRFGYSSSDEVVRWATDWIAAGVEDDGFLQVAAWQEADARSPDDLLRDIVTKEIGDVPGIAGLAFLCAASLASDDGADEDPVSTARKIALISSETGHDVQALIPFVALTSDWDDVPSRRREITDEIRERIRDLAS